MKLHFTFEQQHPLRYFHSTGTKQNLEGEKLQHVTPPPRPEQQHSSEIQRRLCAVTCGFCQLPQLHTVKNETASQHIIPQRQWGSHKILAFHTKGCIYMRMLLMIAINRTTFIPEPTQITIFVKNYLKCPATEIVDIFGQR